LPRKETRAPKLSNPWINSLELVILPGIDLQLVLEMKIDLTAHKFTF